jgi:hypothetical protein
VAFLNDTCISANVKKNLIPDLNNGKAHKEHEEKLKRPKLLLPVPGSRNAIYGKNPRFWISLSAISLQCNGSLLRPFWLKAES